MQDRISAHAVYSGYLCQRRRARPVISFEFFPTKTPEGERTLLEKTIPALGALKPDFCSVTYGAGGSTREKTLTIVDRIQREHAPDGDGAHDVRQRDSRGHRGGARAGASLGITNILALRGDPPGGSESSKKRTAASSFRTSSFASSRSSAAFSIGVAGFPEGHIACADGKFADWRHLKHKIDQGADFVITQLFFDNKDYFEFRDYLAALGVRVPLIPGIMPILSAAQIKRIVALCGADLPDEFVRELDRRGNDDEAVTQFGIEYATQQCEELLREGVPGLHFYTLNKARSTVNILENLGLTRQTLTST